MLQLNVVRWLMRSLLFSVRQGGEEGWMLEEGAREFLPRQKCHNNLSHRPHGTTTRQMGSIIFLLRYWACQHTAFVWLIQGLNLSLKYHLWCLTALFELLEGVLKIRIMWELLSPQRMLNVRWRIEGPCQASLLLGLYGQHSIRAQITATTSLKNSHGKPVQISASSCGWYQVFLLLQHQYQLQRTPWTSQRAAFWQNRLGSV